jgi:hypothetical protein
MQFLNISNHPVEGWSASQREAALALAPDADLLDVDFPTLDPQWSRVKVKVKAIEFIDDLDPRPGARAMVAGEEPIMCFYLVRELQALGVACYSATTERVVEERDGVKTSRFSFVRFREWPAL